MAFRQRDTFRSGGAPRSPVVEFSGEWGGNWRYDTSKPLAPPGGFGTVYEGLTEGDEPVAVKVVAAGRLDGAVLNERLLRREVDIAERLKRVVSGNIMPVLDVGRVGADVVIVMPRADGSLAEAVGTLSLPEAVAALCDIARGLYDLHEAGIVHRDLKPGNVLRIDGSWRLSDFGIARDADLGTQTHTFAGAGTFAYMAPELWRPPYSPTPKSDLYALGVLAFELLTGSHPFPGPGAPDYMNQHENGIPPCLPDQTPGAVRDAVVRLLHKDPAQRHQDARAVLDRLARATTMGSPLQHDLQLAAASHAEERTRQSAEEMATQGRMEREERERVQVLADLLEVMRDASIELGKALPDVAFGVVPGGEWACSFWNDDVSLRFVTWPPFASRASGDSLILAGEVLATSRRFPEQRLIANIVAELDSSGRLVWNLYRFEAAGHVAGYDRGPSGWAHGLEQRWFQDAMEREFMLLNAMHVWTLDVRLLTREAVLTLFQVALTLR